MTNMVADMAAEMEVDKVADMVADMAADKKITKLMYAQKRSWCMHEIEVDVRNWAEAV